MMLARLLKAAPGKKRYQVYRSMNTIGLYHKPYKVYLNNTPELTIVEDSNFNYLSLLQSLLPSVILKIVNQVGSRLHQHLFCPLKKTSDH